jgi:hypothetical protein
MNLLVEELIQDSFCCSVYAAGFGRCHIAALLVQQLGGFAHNQARSGLLAILRLLQLGLFGQPGLLWGVSGAPEPVQPSQTNQRTVFKYGP